MSEPEKITLAKDLHAKLTAFKPIFDTIIEETFTFEEYANIVLSMGLDKMPRRRTRYQKARNGRRSRWRSPSTTS